MYVVKVKAAKTQQYKMGWQEIQVRSSGRQCAPRPGNHSDSIRVWHASTSVVVTTLCVSFVQATGFVNADRADMLKIHL